MKSNINKPGPAKAMAVAMLLAALARDVAAAGQAAAAHAGHAETAPASDEQTPHPGVDEIRGVRPDLTLRSDEFDAPVPLAVSEAIKAGQGMTEGHHAHGITPGEDDENPPTPAPAFRDGPGQETTVVPDAPAVYACPMHPEVTSGEAGTCPKCGMALVRKRG